MSERRRLRRGLGGFLAASVLVPVISSAAAAGATGEDVASENARSGIADCAVGDSRLTDLNDAEDWAPVTREKWEFTGDEVILAEAGDPRPGPRRPSEYAVVTPGREFGAVQLDAEVRIDTPDSTDNRAVILVFGFESDTEYYYAHLSQDNTIYAHNGIFKVNNADRERIDDQWDGSTAAPPAITDEEYHQVRLVHCPDSGEMAVYMDGSDTPLMTATDVTFSTGRVGFGSFGNIGRIRDLTVSGTPAETCSEADNQPTVVDRKSTRLNSSHVAH